MSRELPWERLGNLATVKAGATPARKNGDRFYIGGTINWVKTGDLNNGRLYATEERVTEEAVNETSLSVHPPGTVLVAMYGGLQQIGRSALLECPATTNQAISALIPDRNKMLGEFLNYCLVSLRPNWRKVAASSRKDPNITKQDVLDFQVPVPPLHEQRRIAEILSSVDEAIAATRAVIEQTRKVKQGVLERLLTKGIGYTRFKQTEIGEIPEGWQSPKVADVASVKGGKRMPAGRPFADCKTDHPYVRVSDFREGSIDKSSLVYVLPEDQKLIARYTISARDVYISIAGTIGVSGMVPADLDGAQLTENAAKISVHSEAHLMPEFLSLLIPSRIVQEQIAAVKGVGGGVPKLALFRIEGLSIPVPPREEQEQIVQRSSSINEALVSANSSLSTLLATKSALMSDLLTGRKRVTGALPMAAE
ncbi:MAG: restriction endonuclease subunit S [Alphaproteobacteria bacterium]|nr:restriction endonuclease subunit S [Alphaproteobacteria bacterium]